MSDISATIQNSSDGFGVRISGNEDGDGPPIQLEFVNDEGDLIRDSNGIPDQVLIDFDTARDLARLLPILVRYIEEGVDE